MTPPLSPEVQRFIAEGKLIDAIKRLREERGLGLKAAKDLVDSARHLAATPSAGSTQARPTALTAADSGLEPTHQMLANETRRLREGLSPGEVRRGVGGLWWVVLVIAAALAALAWQRL